MPTDARSLDRRAFDETGYSVIDDAVSEADCERLLAEGTALFERLRSRWVREYDARPSSSGPPLLIYRPQDVIGDRGLRPDGEIVFHRIANNLERELPTLRRVLTSEPFVGTFSALGMRDPRYVASSYLIKPPLRIPNQPIAHQDSSIVHTRPESTVTLWFSLEDATVETGCVWVAPGRFEAAETYRRVEEADAPEQLRHERKACWDPSRFVPVPMKKGGLLVMDGNLPHQHRANFGPVPVHRFAFICADLANEYPHSNFVRLDDGAPFFSPFSNDIR